MPIDSVQSELLNRHLTLAIVDTVQMWTHPKYRGFLHDHPPSALSIDWFNWFVGAWQLARTIGANQRGNVFDYLEKTFQPRIRQTADADFIDEAARHIQTSGWSSKPGRKPLTQSSADRRYALPISLVSKVAFFLKPDVFVPMDSYAVSGLKQLFVHSQNNLVNDGPYRTYLNRVNVEFGRMESVLSDAVKEPWLTKLADKLGLGLDLATSIAFRRKVFDAYLMRLGGYDG